MMTCLFLPRSLCCSWYSRLTLSISSHFSQQPVKLTKFLARISFSCRTLRSSMSFRQLRSDREALRMVTKAFSGFQFKDKGKQRKRNQSWDHFDHKLSSQHVEVFSTCWLVRLVIYPDGTVRCSVASYCKTGSAWTQTRDVKNTEMKNL